LAEHPFLVFPEMQHVHWLCCIRDMWK